MSLVGLVRADRRTHRHWNVFIFANVVFLGVSYMTYCREMIHTKNVVRERVSAILISCPSPFKRSIKIVLYRFLNPGPHFDVSYPPAPLIPCQTCIPLSKKQRNQYQLFMSNTMLASLLLDRNEQNIINLFVQTITRPRL
jgi:hypothetical protein